jgi:pilus assembly protein CpaB
MLLALALGCGLVASIGISQVMDRPAQVTLETAQIYVAKHNINLGDPIDAEMLSLQEWPKDKVPRGAISELSELEGRRPRTAIIEGEPILQAKLLDPGQVADPITQIPKGMRLKTIEVDATKSAAGLLGPGDRVDVQLFVRKDARTGVEMAKSKIILQNIRVFAVDQTVQRSPEGGDERAIAKTVSLMLTPEQASKLSLAEQVGEISLIPRNPDDDELVTWAEMKIEDLLGDGESSSREKERGEDETLAENEDKPAEQGSLVDAVAAATPPPVPPFKMEIVEAQNVREMLFDGETGKPIRQLVEAPITSGPSVTPSLSPAVGAGGSMVSPDDVGKTLDDFPIDLRMKN